MSDGVNMYEKMKSLDPDRYAIATAIRELTSPKDIKKFYDDCVTYYLANGNFGSRMNAETRVGEDISTLLGHCDKETNDLWKGALPKIRHPVWDNAMTHQQFVDFMNADKGTKH